MTLADLVDENSRRYGDRTAFVGENAGERLTFRQVADYSARLAGALAGRGVGRGDVIMCISMNDIGVFQLFFAVARLGARLLPVNWRQSNDEIRFVLEDAAPSAVFYDADWQEIAAEDWVPLKDLGGLLSASPPLMDNADEDDPVLQLYTAAFEGKPRAALLSHRALLAISVQQIAQFRVGHDDVFLNSGPLFHVGDWIHALPVFHMGGTNVVPRKFSARTCAELIQREGVTWAYLVPPMGRELLDASADLDLSSIRRGIAPEDADRWFSRTAAARQPALVPYGQTEVTGIATYMTPAPGAPADGAHSLPLACIRLVTPAGEDVDPGGVGEIIVRGPTVMVGYARDAEENRRRFRDGWFHTSDLGRRHADGTISFVGPMREIIKSGAENIYPEEVEIALLKHPGIADVCVIGMPDEKWQNSVKAVVVPAGEGDLTAGEVIEFCRAQIASYKKPRHVEFVAELPKRGRSTDRERVHELYGTSRPGQHL
jgi:long-chain acyl-CoA synthetase